VYNGRISDILCKKGADTMNNFIQEQNRIYQMNDNNDVIAEVTFPAISDNVVNVNHTFVDDSLRGQGIAGKLMEATVATLREQNKKAQLTCTYAITWFEKHPENADVVA